MKKKIIFFLWLVIGFNVLAMEQKADDSKPIADMTKKLAELLKAFSHLGIKFTELDALKIEEGNIEPHKVGAVIVERQDIDEKNRRIVKIVDDPNIIIMTPDAEFHCLEAALNSSTYFRDGMEKAKRIERQGISLKTIEEFVDKNDAALFELMLKMLHKSNNNHARLSPREYLEFLYLNIIYKCDEIVVASFIATDLAYAFSFTKEEIEASLDQKFTARRDMQFLHDIVAYVPFWAVEYCLKNPAFKTDSENTTIFLLLAWAEKHNDLAFITSMLRHIRWKDISLEYLVTIVKKQVYKYDTTTFRNFYLLAVKHKLATLETDEAKKNQLLLEVDLLQADLNYSLDLKSHAKAYDGANKSFAMRIHYKKIDEWQKGEKYYSQPILWGGYQWYFFARAEESTKTGLSYLAGYVRAVAIGEPHHCLYVKPTIEILEQSNKFRKIFCGAQLFDLFDKSLGSQINENDIPFVINLRSGNVSHAITGKGIETWDQIKRGKSKIVNPDDMSITVILTVDYLPLTEEKIAELTDPKFWQLKEENN